MPLRAGVCEGAIMQIIINHEMEKSVGVFVKCKKYLENNIEKGGQSAFVSQLLLSANEAGDMELLKKFDLRTIREILADRRQKMLEGMESTNKNDQEEILRIS
ncbi:hypothetical protein [Cytobacillus sp. IB215665]|uniref:hypothetical protein n=1 Tax=Cytobacillus sp. IB215665 TaxID=3097357 RepID=UPI002A0E5223|nr:hypothetical protein [Cytobacillus sp. IB215665]MDX8367682.1 hypothetical protein [Cytobacillus sp. IB215665]